MAVSWHNLGGLQLLQVVVPAPHSVPQRDRGENGWLFLTKKRNVSSSQAVVHHVWTWLGSGLGHLP